MKLDQQTLLIQFLQKELAISPDAIATALGQTERTDLLPMVLWQQGALTLEQLERTWRWLESTNLPPNPTPHS